MRDFRRNHSAGLHHRRVIDDRLSCPLPSWEREGPTAKLQRSSGRVRGAAARGVRRSRITPRERPRPRAAPSDRAPAAPAGSRAPHQHIDAPSADLDRRREAVHLCDIGAMQRRWVNSANHQLDRRISGAGLLSLPRRRSGHGSLEARKGRPSAPSANCMGMR
jgi:hypothetical protein